MTSRILKRALILALSVAPLLALADAGAKPQCSCCAKGADPEGAGLVARFLQTRTLPASTLKLADAKTDSLPSETVAVLDSLVAIQKSLAADSIDHVAHQAKSIAKAAAGNDIAGLAPEAAAQAEAVATAKDIKSAREAFKKLSASFEAFLKQHPDKSGTYRVAYCPMAKAGWVQTGDTIANPYFGSSMLKCGSFKN